MSTLLRALVAIRAGIANQGVLGQECPNCICDGNHGTVVVDSQVAIPHSPRSTREFELATFITDS